jgi:hypothetical protein
MADVRHLRRASLAAARMVAETLHGKETVERVAGPFDPQPLTTAVERLKQLKQGPQLRSK